MQFTKEEIKEINSYGSVSYYMQIIKDLQKRGVELDCNLTISDFIEKMLERAKTGGVYYA